MVSSPGTHDHRFCSSTRGTMSWMWSAVTTCQSRIKKVLRDLICSTDKFPQTQVPPPCTPHKIKATKTSFMSPYQFRKCEDLNPGVSDTRVCAQSICHIVSGRRRTRDIPHALKTQERKLARRDRDKNKGRKPLPASQKL